MTVQARAVGPSVSGGTTSPTGGSAVDLPPEVRIADDVGMTTAEYAVGTVAACGFAGILFKLLTSDLVRNLLTDLIKRALDGVF